MRSQPNAALFFAALPAIALFTVVVACSDRSLAQTYPSTDYPHAGYPHTQSYGVVPSSPSRPAPTNRPQSWPSGPPRPPMQAPAVPGPPAMGGRPPNAGPPMQPCENTLIVARVGSEVILGGEVLAAIPNILEMGNRRQPKRLRLSPEKLEKQRIELTEQITLGIRELAAGVPVPDGQPANQLEAERLQRRLLVQQLLGQLVETRLLYCDAKRTIPAEGFPQITKSLEKQFEEVEIKSLLEQEDVASRRELEQKLRLRGSSIDREKKAFARRILAQQWLQNQVKNEDEVTHEEMLEYYRAHGEEFDHPARVKWKELMARFSQYDTREEAGAAISQMGNLVFSGKPFEDVARANSDGATAHEGGLRDWTTKGSLRSEVLDRELFNPNLLVGQLSPIIESEQGFHILLVTDREVAHRTPFAEVQADIKKAIRRERSNDDLREYVARLRDQIPVWVIFDDQPNRSELTQHPTHPRR